MFADVAHVAQEVATHLFPVALAETAVHLAAAVVKHLPRVIIESVLAR